MEISTNLTDIHAGASGWAITAVMRMTAPANMPPALGNARFCIVHLSRYKEWELISIQPEYSGN